MSESEATRQANNVTPPTSSATPGVGVTAIATTTAAVSLDLFQTATQPYEGFFDRYVELMAVGADILFSFSATAVTIALAAGTTISGSTSATQPSFLINGIPRPYRLNKTDHRFLNIKASSGTPILIITPSSQPGLK